MKDLLLLRILMVLDMPNIKKTIPNLELVNPKYKADQNLNFKVYNLCCILPKSTLSKSRDSQPIMITNNKKTESNEITFKFNCYVLCSSFDYFYIVFSSNRCNSHAYTFPLSNDQKISRSF